MNPKYSEVKRRTQKPKDKLKLINLKNKILLKQDTRKQMLLFETL